MLFFNIPIVSPAYEEIKDFFIILIMVVILILVDKLSEKRERYMSVPKKRLKRRKAN